MTKTTKKSRMELLESMYLQTALSSNTPAKRNVLSTSCGSFRVNQISL